MSLTKDSEQWCDAIKYSGYLLQKQPTLGSRNGI